MKGTSREGVWRGVIPALALAAWVAPGAAGAGDWDCSAYQVVWCDGGKSCCLAVYPVCPPAGYTRCCPSSTPVVCADNATCMASKEACACYDKGEDVCGQGCMPKGSACCGDGSYCPSGSRCDARCGCLPDGATCCSDGSYCEQGTECDCNGCVEPGAVCCADGTVCAQGTECGCGGCMEAGATCCGNNTYCGAGQTCCGSGCAPAGGVCCGSVACASGQACCGDGCMPAGSVCCATGYCPSGTSCDGSMCRGPGQDQISYSCPASHPKLCTNVSPPFCCPNGTGCGDRQCTVNYQPPPSSTQPPTSAATPSPTRRPKPTGQADGPSTVPVARWGCSAAAGDPSWLALGALAALFFFRPRRRWARTVAVVTAAWVLVGAEAASDAAPAEPCPAGQERNSETLGHCCWADQAWSKVRQVCVGIPQCPQAMKAVGEACVVDCEPGKVVNEETQGQCCWPAQVWAKSRGRCVGIPACPPGRTASGEECLPGQAAPATPAPPASPTVRAQPVYVPTPPPVYTQPAVAPVPQPVYVQPQPAAAPAPQPVYVQPQPAVAPAPQPVYGQPQPTSAPPAAPAGPDAAPPYNPVYAPGKRAPAPSASPRAGAGGAPTPTVEAKPTYRGLKWIMELELAYDAASKFPGALLHLDIPIGTKQLFAIGVGGGVFAQIGGTGDKVLVVPIPVRISYRIAILDTGLQVIPLVEAVPNFVKLGSLEKWGVKFGGGLKVHYSRLLSGPGVSLGCEVFGLDGTVVLVGLGLTI